MRRLGAPDADLLNGYIFKLSQTVVADGYPDPAVDLLAMATPCRVEPLSTEFRHECRSSRSRGETMDIENLPVGRHRWDDTAA